MANSNDTNYISVDKLIKSLEVVHSGEYANEHDRALARDALLAALRQTQVPYDIAIEHSWQNPVETAAIKTLIDIKFWKKWAEAGAKPGKIDDLARLSDGIDPVLLRRLLRMLAGRHFVHETDVDTFAATAFSKALAQDPFPGVYTLLYTFTQPAFANFPKFAAESNYVNPTDGTKSNWQSWQKPGVDVFGYLASHPEAGKGFYDAMQVLAAGKPSWTEIYPTQTIVSAGESKLDRVLLVDVGGGVGQDLESFRLKHPDVREGSLVLQDLPNVVNDAVVKPPATKQAADFFKPQPITGARAYYLHMVLHDWSADKAVEILKNLATALEKGFSRILVHEQVLPAEKANPVTVIADLTMMMAFSAEERSEAQWRDIIDKAGLRLVKIWSVVESPESVLELELA